MVRWNIKFHFSRVKKNEHKEQGIRCFDYFSQRERRNKEKMKKEKQGY